MSDLLLDSLRIQNFRGFRDLQIPRLGRVNLIVGKNNVGKSSLLEALRIYARGGAPSVIFSLLKKRDESHFPVPRKRRTENTHLYRLKNLFYGRNDIEYHSLTINIGPMDDPGLLLSISLGLYKKITDGTNVIIDLGQIRPDKDTLTRPTGFWFNIQLGENNAHLPIDVYLDKKHDTLIDSPIPHVYIRENGFNHSIVNRLWGDIVLTNLEKYVLEALHIIEPDIEKLNIISSDPMNATGSFNAVDRNRIDKERIPIVVVGLKGLDNPIPLRSLGDGINRLFGIALALVNAQNGLLLIDEIESGLHYSIQADMWRLIFQVAQRLNVQVFATTHSWDCIKAFTKAAVENTQEEGVLIRLQEDDKGDIVSTIFDEEDLPIVVSDHAEVR